MYRKPEKRRIHGVGSGQEIEKKQLYRDVSPLSVKIFHAMRGVEVQTTLILALSVTAFLIPGLLWFCFIINLLTAAFSLMTSRNARLPWKLPKTSGIKRDPGNRKPNSRRFGPAEGVYYIGNEYGSNEELWLSVEDILAHLMDIGTTGSGKTEFFISLAFNALATTSSFLFIDAKAAPNLHFKLYKISRMLGRDDDFLLLNFRTGGKDIEATIKNMSNTSNPFAFGSSDALTQMLISQMPKEKGRNSIFQSNAQTLVTGLMRSLVELRDTGVMYLSIDTIREYFTVEKYIELSERADMSIETRKGVKSALSTVGWREGKSIEDQTQAFTEQFGYAAAYFGLIISNLTNTYGHIYRTVSGEVDMYDVIKNRRILVGTLPATEKAPQTMENLGKIVLSDIRNACAVGLGEKIAGSVDEVLNSLPTNSETPILSITDEYAAIATPGYEQIFTQGRGLGVAGILGNQDISGLKKADDLGAQQMVENTRTKLVKRLEGGEETWRLFNTIAGQGKIMMSSGSEIRPESVTSAYRDKMAAAPQSVDRIDLRDLQSQKQGEFHGLHNGTIVRGSVFYADVQLKPEDQFRINQGLNVMPPLKLDTFYSILAYLSEDWYQPMDWMEKTNDNFHDFSVKRLN